MIRKQLTTKEITEKKSRIEYLLRAITSDKNKNNKWQYAWNNELERLLNNSIAWVTSSEKYGVDVVMNQLIIY